MRGGEEPRREGVENRIGGRAVRGGPAPQLAREIGVDAVEERLRFLLGLHELEFEERRLADERLGALLIQEPRELDQDPVLSLPLDRRLRDAELVDAVVDDLPHLLHGVLGFRGAELGGVDFQQEVHPALEIEAELDRAIAELDVLLELDPLRLVGGFRGPGLENLLPDLGRKGVELERGPERHERSQHEGHREVELPLVAARHHALERSFIGTRLVPGNGGSGSSRGNARPRSVPNARQEVNAGMDDARLVTARSRGRNPGVTREGDSPAKAHDWLRGNRRGIETGWYNG